ncbi:unnamed protein product [Rhodiola kirilowii]
MAEAAAAPCLFCQIARSATSTKLLYSDEKVAAFQDINPSALRHYLVIPVEHIATVRDLHRRTADYELVSHMLTVGQTLLHKDAPQSKYRFGFHQPPFNSVDHLHLHCLALPYKPSWRHLKYISLGPFGGFIEADKLLEKIKPLTFTHLISITPEPSTPLFPLRHAPSSLTTLQPIKSLHHLQINQHSNHHCNQNYSFHSISFLNQPISMAASLALKRAAATSSLFSKLLNPSRPVQLAPTASRFFNTNAQMTRYDDSDDSNLEVDQRDRSVSNRVRPGVPSVFSDVFDPLSPTRSLTQVLNMMDQFMENPFLAASRGMGTGARRGWDVKEDNNGLYLRMDMPGLDKENVKISVEQNTLVIKGEGEQETEEEESKRRYSSRIDLPPNLYKLDGIKAEMKNGVLKVAVPKVKQEERTDVHHVQIE